MFQYGIVAGGAQIKHQHADGTWAPMEAEDPHDRAQADPERDWERGHVYVCTVCHETISVSEGEAPDEPDAAAPGGR